MGRESAASCSRREVPATALEAFVTVFVIPCSQRLHGRGTTRRRQRRGSCCNAQFGRLITADELCYSHATVGRATLKWPPGSRLSPSLRPPPGHVILMPPRKSVLGLVVPFIHMSKSVTCVYPHRKHRPKDLLSIAMVMS